MSAFADSVIPEESGGLTLGFQRCQPLHHREHCVQKQQGWLTLFLLGFENQFHLCSETSGVNLAISNMA